MSVEPTLRRVSFVLCAAYSVCGSAIALIGLGSPARIVPIGLLVVFVGLVALVAGILEMFLLGMEPVARRAWPPPSGRLSNLLAGTAVVAAGCSVVGFIRASGDTADLASGPPGCVWRIIATHSTHDLCVSHARWLEIAAGNFIGTIGAIAVLTAILCALTGWVRRRAAGNLAPSRSRRPTVDAA